MQNVFDAKWVIMTKNPYAVVQSTIETYLRGNINPSNKAEDIAKHVINTYYVQKKNRELLADNAYVMTYENFTANPEAHVSGIKVWMPELHDVSFSGACLVKDKECHGLVNNNDERISTLKTIPNAINKFNAYFEKHVDILNYWGYELI